MAYHAYAKGTFAFNNQASWYYKLSLNQWYFNSFYDVFLIKILMLKTKAFYWFDQKIIDGFIHLLSNIVIIISKIASWFDRYVIDGLVNGSAWLVSRLGIWLRGMQSGKLQHYFIWMLLVFLSFFIYKLII
jgi:NADH-quinone oxidoreductase subunit L